MGKLIIPKNSADRKDLDACFDIYFKANDWVTNEFLIDKMRDALGLPHQEPQAYTKKTQILAYYGFIEWEDKSNSQSRRKITESGIRFYNAIKSGDETTLFSELINTLETLTFGRNVCGCDSDSNFEPPQIFIRCVLALGYLTYLEFGYILLELEENNGNIFDLLTSVATNRITGKRPYISNRYSDPKVILALINWGFLQNDGKVGGNNKIIINPKVLSLYADRLQQLRIFNDVISDGIFSNDKDSSSIEGINKIYYGAPGTGKSYKVDKILEVLETKYYERVTFHPEYDNSSFIGGYKPVSVKERYEDEEGEYFENEVHYKFVPQAFTNIYERAWQDLENQYYLVIEEINRGNCAEIFGEIFQLLDRTSKYTVSPTKELKEYLISEAFKDENHQGIVNGLKLPPNLSILATMNTSDQSLFPMDSAFKRRWDWEYIPICYNPFDDFKKKNDSFDFEIDIEDGKKYSWIKFIEKINLNHIKVNPSLGMDKCIGNYFIKPDKGIVISLRPFVNKVIFYLWNDVFKDEDNNVFEENTSYEDFFPIETNGKKKIKELFDRIDLKAIPSLEIVVDDNPLRQVAESPEETES